MANEIVKMANEEFHMNRRIGVDVHCLWCVDHRLNLVARDFEKVPNINFVIRFIDWITARDRLVSYTAFVKSNTDFPKKKKIPPPSETRWLFYRDALTALLDQTREVDAFLNINQNRQKWARHIASSKHPLGQVRDVFTTFEHPLVIAHFKFAHFILNVLAEINTIFQAKYGFITDFWDYLMSLGVFLKKELFKIQNGDFSRFDFPVEINVEDRPQFEVIMKHLILNSMVRFYTPSFSLEKKSIKRFLDYENMTVLPGAPLDVVDRCGLTPLLNIFNMRYTTIHGDLVHVFQPFGISEEWPRFFVLAFLKKEEVLQVADERSHVYGPREREMRILLQTPRTPNLVDGFGVVGKTGYNNLWRFFVRLLTIMPTTVACEQSFSFFKRTIHTNMSEETAKIFLNGRMVLYENNYNL